MNKKVSTSAHSKLQGTHSSVYIVNVSGGSGPPCTVAQVGYCATQQGCIYTDLDVTGVLPRVEQGTTCTVIPVCHGHCGTAVFVSKGAPWKCCEKHDSFLCF